MRVAGIALLVLLLAGCGQHPGVAGSANAVVQPAPSVAPTVAEHDAAGGTEMAAAPSEVPAISSPSPAPTAAAPVAVPPSPTSPADEPTEPAGDEVSEAPSEQPSPDDEDGEDPDPSSLYGRSFASTRIIQDGEPRPHADGASVLITPYRRDGTTYVRWNGGCNTGGASVTITETRFLVGNDGAQTDMYCNPESRMEQEQWFNRFMHRDLQWEQSDDGTVTLTAGDTVITFEERRWPPPWEADR
jgi:hypothetical protein